MDDTEGITLSKCLKLTVALGFCLWAFPLRAEIVSIINGATFDSFTPISSTTTIDDTGFTPFIIAFPTRTIGFHAPAFDTNLGVLERAEVELSFDFHTTTTITLYGLPPVPEVGSFGVSPFNTSVTLLGGGVPISSGSGGFNASSSCSGVGASVSCMQSGNMSFGLFSLNVSPEQLENLELLIEPVLEVNIAIFGFLNYENFAQFENTIDLNPDIPNIISYHYTPVSAVPVPAALPL